jgi:uncharacterized OB-fold protein
MSEPALPAPAPPINPESRPYWEATAEGKLLLPRCTTCGTVIWYPRTICPACGSRDVGWFEAAGRGTIYSFSVNRRGMGDYQGIDSYVLAYVELTEGPRMLTNIVDCDPQSLAVGQQVEVVFHDTGKGSALPRFRPA